MKVKYQKNKINKIFNLQIIFKNNKTKCSIKQKQIKQKQTNKLRVFFLFQFILINKNITNQNKQTIFTEEQVSDQRCQCNLLKQKLSLINLHHQFYFLFLNIQEKVNNKLISQLEGQNEEKYEITRNELINDNKRKI
ncbi:hypothetical protein TTHERM_000752101 (macronuclear) [Tetrahymena thermophila SB210]|uniref:Uncharacterized protein n=1 Tax=Tetrahymena thermophila (strain SB210) TaxID=312017 RepID=W7X8Z4_TETTS|nr:hypothetical protein TTHERM_000752101 [Tetrahymena thermophila SB210]EWS73812.1 hypothetical protein TTHERM_000752101 [Tetrahymena thermophila SB210]|eukprot:XP_012653635.1 hypothetical protein TTHERM_000752101 [Tetrahymena thermophila SB210]